MDFVQSVLEFNRIGGNANEFNARNVAKYIGFLLEEVQETISTLPYDTKFVELCEVLQEFGDDFKRGRYDEQCDKIDVVEALDGAIDCAVIGIGLGNALGADVWNAALHAGSRYKFQLQVVDQFYDWILGNHSRMVRKQQSGQR